MREQRAACSDLRVVLESCLEISQERRQRARTQPFLCVESSLLYSSRARMSWRPGQGFFVNLRLTSIFAGDFYRSRPANIDFANLGLEHSRPSVAFEAAPESGS